MLANYVYLELCTKVNIYYIMNSKYQYEKILTTLNEQDFSKSSYESLFDNLEFSDAIPQHK